MLAPPIAGARIGEIWKGAQAGPDDVVVLVAHERLAEKLPLSSTGVDGIVLVYFDSRVDDRDQLHTECIQLAYQSGRIREPLRIPGEDPIFIHVVDVEIDGIEGNAALAKRSRHLHELVRGFI